jgi:signal transduction histidine kinase
MNVIKNGLEAMPEGGILDLRVDSSIQEGQTWVNIFIQDSGAGISDEQKENIFKLFYTTKEHGLGYGLWRDRNFIRSLGGEISFESQPGLGTTFAILIPESARSED